MKIQFGTVDGLVNITQENIWCFVNAIKEFMKQNGPELAKKNSIAYGTAFQRFVDPVWNDSARPFNISDINTPVYTTNGNEQSPARITFCKKMGLLEIDEKNGIFKLTPLGEAFVNKEITLQEYAFILISKMGVFSDGNYIDNVLNVIAEYFKSQPTISDSLLEDYILNKYSITKLNIEKTRFDIIVNAVEQAGLIKSIPKTNLKVLANTEYAEIFMDFQIKKSLLTPAKLDTDSDYSDYMGALDYGIFDVMTKESEPIYTKHFPNLHKYIKNIISINDTFPLQQIFYGAPGTGKSHTIKEQTKGDDTVIRTTFHPDSDYSTFVGCYKPTMSEKPKPIYGFDAIGKTVKVDEERKIEYKFIQQAFTKAYIQAWKKMVDYHPKYRTFYVGSTKYDIIGISGDLVRVKVSDREDSEDIEIRKSELEDIFKTKDSHDVEQNHDKEEEQNRNKELWNNPNELGLNNPNEIKPDPSDIDKIKERLGGDIFKGIDKSFDDAWTFLEKGFLKPQFLIIEEINRGNCAQIFGDLFQLLDRGDDGYSEYPIEADDDLRKELEREFDKLNLDALKHEIDSIFKENYPHGITDKIKSGKLLVLPKNLFIWATMNTSDQSLFPIDSAFKRRWEWKYQPIIKGVDEKTGKELDWKIKIDGYQPVDWWEFIERINNVIFNLTSSEDKQLGYFFCKPESKEKTTISAKRFVEKVIFYLWNDVFKDYSYDPECCNKKDKKDEKVQYSDFYTSDGKDIDTEVIANFINQLKTKDGKESPLAIKE